MKNSYLLLYDMTRLGQFCVSDFPLVLVHKSLNPAYRSKSHVIIGRKRKSFHPFQIKDLCFIFLRHSTFGPDVPSTKRKRLKKRNRLKKGLLFGSGSKVQRGPRRQRGSNPPPSNSVLHRPGGVQGPQLSSMTTTTQFLSVIILLALNTTLSADICIYRRLHIVAGLCQEAFCCSSPGQVRAFSLLVPWRAYCTL
jgi:hypothetical protein